MVAVEGGGKEETHPVPSSAKSACGSPCRLNMLTIRFWPHVARNDPCGCHANMTEPAEWCCGCRVNNFFCGTDNPRVSKCSHKRPRGDSHHCQSTALVSGRDRNIPQDLLIFIIDKRQTGRTNQSSLLFALVAINATKRRRHEGSSEQGELSAPRTRAQHCSC